MRIKLWVSATPRCASFIERTFVDISASMAWRAVSTKRGFLTHFWARCVVGSSLNRMVSRS